MREEEEALDRLLLEQEQQQLLQEEQEANNNNVCLTTTISGAKAFCKAILFIDNFYIRLTLTILSLHLCLCS